MQLIVDRFLFFKVQVVRNESWVQQDQRKLVRLRKDSCQQGDSHPLACELLPFLYAHILLSRSFFLFGWKYGDSLLSGKKCLDGESINVSSW